ncbi:MAG: hypothetical protein AAFV77_07255 [Planctomycetota bacterium]
MSGTLRGGFPTTRWTLIERARSNDPADRERAMEELCQRFWPAIYAAARAIERDTDAAADLTQGFFSDVVLGRGLVVDANPERGRLRTLLMVSLKHYARDGFRRNASRERAWRAPDHLLMVERRAEARSGDPQAAFDRRWAAQILAESMDRCAAHYRRTGKGAHWDAFEARVVTPLRGGPNAPSMDVIAAKHDFKSASAVRAALQVVRHRMEAFVREVVAETVGSNEFEDEVKLVWDSLGARVSS